MNKLNIYVVGGYIHYADFIYNSNVVKDINDADIVLFTGGEDVTPSLYGESAISETFFNIERDKCEMGVFNNVNAEKQICIGVCRGSQFLTVANGGKLIQHVTNHGLYGTHGIHSLKDDLEDCDITSTHHQMMYPYDMNEKDYDILYVSSENRSSIYKTGNSTMKDLGHQEPEVVLYHKEGNPVCLAIQGHPEMMDKESPAVQNLNKIIAKLTEND